MLLFRESIMWRCFLDTGIQCGVNGTLSNLRRMVVKTNASFSDAGNWDTGTARLWWFCLLLILLLILFSGQSFGQGSITGSAWLDANKNGIQDPSERGFSGVRVQLFRRLVADSFEELTSLRTSSDGSCLFIVSGDLLPADFYLRFEKVDGMFFSPPDRGSDNLVDSDVDTSSGQTSIFSLASQGNVVGLGAGYMSSPLIDPPIEPAANVNLMVTASDDSASIGETIEFLIQVGNAGPDSSIAPALTMEVSPMLQIISANPAPAGLTENPLRWTLPSIAPGGQIQVTVQVLVLDDGEAIGAVCLAPATEDPDLSDNCQQYHLDAGVPVELVEFKANYTARGVLLRWITASETENFGFDIYRADEENGIYSKITPALIEGAGTSSSEHRYQHLDIAVSPGRTYYYKLQDIDYSGQTAWHGPITAAAALPAAFELAQNYPNPFNARTKIRFSAAQPGYAEMAIYNHLGQQVTRLFAQEWPAGQHEVVWDGTDQQNLPVASGLYIYVLQAGDYREKRSMNLIK